MADTCYVGLASGVCLVEVGNQVLCSDLDPEKIHSLDNGDIPIHEPGLLEMVRRNVAAGRLQFTTDIDRTVPIARFNSSPWVRHRMKMALRISNMYWQRAKISAIG